MDGPVAIDDVPMTYQFSCPATDLATRDMMIRLRSVLQASGITDDLQSSVEIAVAESLNNIVEHACVGRPRAIIQVEMKVYAAYVFVLLQDPGDPFPGWTLPTGQPADLSVPRATLPEGGFGWHMIYALTDRLDYSRAGGMNRLKMWFEPPSLGE